MRSRGQATVDYAGLLALLAVVVLAAGGVAQRQLAASAGGVPPEARRWAPAFVLERGADALVPVDPRACRAAACATGAAAEPVVFVHTVRLGGAMYVQYWSYLPASRTAHTGVPALDGEHADDWEGVIVKLDPRGRPVGARVSAHAGWNGVRPWWDLRRGDWAPYPAPVYRASGSHAGSFARGGIDVAGDRWGGDALRVRPRLASAAELRRAGLRFAPGTTPPWEKRVWSDPEAVTTGPTHDAGRYAAYARWWARACRACRWWSEVP
jgi:hypothetical protein